MSCERDDSSVVGVPHFFLSPVRLPRRRCVRSCVGGGQILRHDFCAFEMTGKGGEMRGGAAPPSQTKNATAAVTTLVEYIYSSRLRGRDCWFGRRRRRRSYFSLLMRVSPPPRRTRQGCCDSKREKRGGEGKEQNEGEGEARKGDPAFSPSLYLPEMELLLLFYIVVSPCLDIPATIFRY